MVQTFDYTPTNIGEIVYHSVTERHLIYDIATGAMAFPVSGKNGILLYGSYGSGKTTLAKLLPDAIERGKGGIDSRYEYVSCQQGQNGALLIARIQKMAQHVSFSHSGYHYFVLDEVDNLTDAAMASLKAAMNLPQTIFVMTTNDICNIDAGVRNRSERINFNAAPAQEWLPFARRVLHDCGAAYVSDEKLLPIIDSCHGSAREIASAMRRLAAQQARVAFVAMQQALPFVSECVDSDAMPMWAANYFSQFQAWVATVPKADNYLDEYRKHIGFWYDCKPIDPNNGFDFRWKNVADKTKFILRHA